MYITITGIEYCGGTGCTAVGQKLYLIKEKNNMYDDEAIRVLNENRIKIGYVANSVHTVARGTHSAGYVYETFAESTVCRVRFIFNESMIAEITDETE